MSIPKLIAALAFVSVCAAPLRAQDSGIPVGSKAPAFAIENLDGKKVDIAPYLGKSPMLLEFWATWCENCHALEPSLLSMQKKYGSRVRFIGIAVSFNESPARVKAYAAKHGYAHEVLYDKAGDASAAYEVPATSYVVVIDGAGKVVYTGLGGDQNLEAAIAKAGVK